MRLIDADVFEEYIRNHCADSLVNLWCELVRRQETVEISPSKWIPVEENLPEDDRYVLLSFENFTNPMVGRYERYKDGSGAWYLRDCDEGDTCIENDLYVNAWRPLPACYRGGEECL